MTLSAQEKGAVVANHRRHDSDSGSVEVQVALISSRLTYLLQHFETHKKDNHSRRGLLKLVGRRRRLLDYLKREDIERYRALIAELGIRK